ncbi:MAG TPA: extracellular solute-binding protein [Acidimicrobiia bacterium]|nr:extracellular solute-binding protein [Acidimicrobiia bacterium]
MTTATRARHRWATIMALALVLAACTSDSTATTEEAGGTTTTSGGAETSTTAGEGTVDGDKPESLNMLYATVEANFDAVNSMIPAFEEATGIQINVDSQPYEALQQRVFAELASESDFYDIIIVDTPWMPALTNQVEPLSGYLADESLNDIADVDLVDFIPAVFYDTAVYNQAESNLRFPGDASTVDLDAILGEGFEVFGLPIQANALTMAYRADLFNDPEEQAGFEAEYGRALAYPVTWDEFTEVAQWFTRPEENLYGTTLMAGAGEWGTTDFKSFAASAGGDGTLVDDQFNITFNDPAAIEGLTFYASLINDLQVTPPGTTNSSWDDTGAAFDQGLTAMTMNYHSFDLESGEVAYGVIPAKAGESPGPHFGTWMLSVNKFSNNKDWAYRAITWFTSSATQIEMLQSQLHPTRVSVYEAAANDPSLTEQFGNFYEALGASLATGQGRPRLTNYGEVSGAVGTAVNAVANGADPQATMDAAAQEVAQLLEQAGYVVGDI